MKKGSGLARTRAGLVACVWVLLVCSSHAPGAPTSARERFLDDVQMRAVSFFVRCAHPKSGLVRDRASNFGPDKHDVASVASTGYGLAALPIGVERGWAKRTDAMRQAERALRFVLGMPHKRGWLYHFVDWRTGERRWDCEISSIDTALLVAGALSCGRYFRGNVERLADRLYDRLDWTWMRTNGGAKPDKLVLSHGWKPETGFLASDWDSYCEHMLLYLLGLGARNNPLGPKSWTAWTRGSYEYGGMRTIAGGPLFWHQMSHGYYDFRGRKDGLGHDYHQAAAIATRTQRRFCADNPTQRKGYGAYGWGLNACDGPDGYMAYGVPKPEDGTLSPTGVLASITVDPKSALGTAMHMRTAYGPRIWGRYGFVNAYNVDRDWFDRDVIGIDLGMALLAVENHRSGLVWRMMGSHPSTARAFGRAGFSRRTKPAVSDVRPLSYTPSRRPSASVMAPVRHRMPSMRPQRNVNGVATKHVSSVMASMRVPTPVCPR